MSVQMTITEALAEIKLITNKIAKKKEFVLDNLTRVKQLPDPFADKGGASVALNAESQSIADLEERLTKIRAAIMRANIETMVTIDDTTRSLYEWMVWKREIGVSKAQFLENIYTMTKRKIDESRAAPKFIKLEEDGTPSIVEVEGCLPYLDYAAYASTVTDLRNKLDGVLSLKNATVLIEV